MSKNLSSLKKNRISLRNRSRNRRYKSIIKTYTKKCTLSIQKINDDHTSANNNEAFINLSLLYKSIDKAVKRGVLHSNTGSRKKSILASAMNINRIV